MLGQGMFGQGILGQGMLGQGMLGKGWLGKGCQRVGRGGAGQRTGHKRAGQGGFGHFVLRNFVSQENPRMSENQSTVTWLLCRQLPEFEFFRSKSKNMFNTFTITRFRGKLA